MNKQELFSYMQSDMQLWERADTRMEGDTLVKTIELPFGIGEFSVNFEGVSDAGKRRAAAESWGGLIRDAVQDYIDDDAITARAAQQAARVSPNADSSDGGSGTDRPEPAKVSDPTAVRPHVENPFESGETATRRLNELRECVEEWKGAIDAAEKEIQALAAYVEIMYASQDTKKADRSGPPEVESSDTELEE